MEKSEKPQPGQTELTLALEYFQRAHTRFKEVLETKDPINADVLRDATVQRFEFTFEMCWKTLKRFLYADGIRVKTPRDVFKEAFRLGWLEEGDTFWSKMLEDRNLTSHTYDQEIALDLRSRLPSYEKAFARLVGLLAGKVAEG